MYSDCLDGTGEFKDFEYHIELDLSKPRIQTPHKVVMSIDIKKNQQDPIGKQGIGDKPIGPLHG